MRDTILCLCDLTGVMARPWVEHGYQAVLVDPQHGCDHEDGAYLKLACTIEEAFDQISVLGRPHVSGEGRERCRTMPGDR